MYGVDGDNLSRWYKHFISDYEVWEQRWHAMDYVLFKENLGERLSMDETALSQGELYTIITNKSAHGGKGSLVAMIQGTKNNRCFAVANWSCRYGIKRFSPFLRFLF